MAYPFFQVDVFSPTPYLGNPVAVIADAGDLNIEQMQRIARWTNLSETTFLLTPTHPDADYRVRIFTPGGELPFAGHPTLGSAHAWLDGGGVPINGDLIIQECEVGAVQVRRDEDGLAFQAPPLLRTGDLDPDYLARIIAAFNIDPAQVLAHQWVDNGPGWAVLHLADARAVLDLEPDLSMIPDAMIGAIGAHPPGHPFAFEIRAFAPGSGVAEDPVCGSLNASVGQWLTRTGVVTGSYRVSQGTRLGRAGEITISPDAAGDVWVGGATTTLFRGSATL